MSGKRKKGKRKEVAAIKLPKIFRDELRMTCALRGFSHLKCGMAMKFKKQQEQLARFYHGQPPDHPSQIKLLAQGSYTYRELYEEESSIITKKSDEISSSVHLYLKPMFSPGSIGRFRAGIDITEVDLEKSLRTGKTLLPGRKILDMARNGVKHYKKALSYCAHKWDLKKGVPIESGTTIEDIIEYVKRRMYINMMKQKSVEDLSVSSSDDDENPDVDEGKNPSGVKDKARTTELDSTKPSPVSVQDGETTTINKDGGNDSAGDEDEDEEIPLDYMFPSFIAFILYGPFVAYDKQLKLLLIDDSKVKKGEGNRKKQRKDKSDSKSIDGVHDQSSVRGFSTDQRIDIERLNVQQQVLQDRRDETSIVALSIEESAIGRQLRDAERRAEQRCPVYDANSSFWEKVDVLLEEQQSVMDKIKAFNNRTNDQIKETSDETSVSNFLNQPSPKAIKKKRVITEVEDVSIGSDSDIEEVTDNNTSKKSVS